MNVKKYIKKWDSTVYNTTTSVKYRHVTHPRKHTEVSKVQRPHYTVKQISSEA